MKTYITLLMNFTKEDLYLLMRENIKKHLFQIMFFIFYLEKLWKRRFIRNKVIKTEISV